MTPPKKSNWTASGFGRYVSPDLISDEFLDDEVIVLLEGNNTFGDRLYCYLQLTCRNLREIFGKIRSGENFKPADFGTVIVAGRGEPSPEIKAEMNNEHHIIDVQKPALPKIDTSQPKFFDED
ncbi:MAG TPA: hypothetical protein VFT64_02610 [Rickettsiales bacterium]|nr:hypothetical protein [Rickettsiales bacterium]